MSTFTVLGVDSSTRKDRVVVVEAGTEDGAAELALERGLAQVKAVRPFEEDRPRAAHADQLPAAAQRPWSPSRPRDMADAVARGVFGGIAGILLTVMWSVLLTLVVFPPQEAILPAAILITAVVVLWSVLSRLRR